MMKIYTDFRKIEIQKTKYSRFPTALLANVNFRITA